MIKLLIVEDETKERRFMCDHINWAMIGAEVINDAWNGQQAVEMVMASRPYIIITDVKMPVMNGVEMAKLVQAIDPTIKIIFNSAYDDFEYAREAANLNAFGYILKPLNDEELLRLVKKAVDKCIHEHMQEAMYLKLKNNMSKGGPLLREAIARETLMGVEVHSEDLLRNAGLEWLNSMDETIGLVLICWEEQDSIHMSDFKQTADDCLKSFRNAVSVKLTSNEVAILISSDSSNEAPAIGQFCKDIRSQVQLKYGIRIHVVFAKELSNRVQLNKMFVDTYKQLELELIYVPDFNQQLAKPVMDVFHAEVIIRFKEEIPGILRIHDEQQLSALINDFYQENLLNKNCDLAYYSGLGYSILSVMVDTVKAVGHQPFSSIDQEISCWIGLARLHTVSRIKSYVLDQALSIMEKLKESKKGNGDQLIERIEQIVIHRYREPLTVEHIAGMMHFSPNYLGAIFKTKRNISITDYINKVRVNKSMELLQDRTLSISDISSLCGYENTPYFHKIFKKHTGITPGEFRLKDRSVTGITHE